MTSTREYGQQKFMSCPSLLWFEDQEWPCTQPKGHVTDHMNKDNGARWKRDT